MTTRAGNQSSEPSLHPRWPQRRPPGDSIAPVKPGSDLQPLSSASTPPSCSNKAEWSFSRSEIGHLSSLFMSHGAPVGGLTGVKAQHVEPADLPYNRGNARHPSVHPSTDCPAVGFCLRMLLLVEGSLTSTNLELIHLKQSHATRS